ncbi:MAG: serine/threonine protein kinase [Myxococcales bacterium]|nr:serine/threonine protein kinase [Myxococcales bacterium]
MTNTKRPSSSKNPRILLRGEGEAPAPLGASVDTGSVLDGRFEVSTVAGEGGHARVFKGTDRSNGATVALKVMRPEYARDPVMRKRFEREGEVLSKIKHPHVVGFIASGSEPTPWMALEFIAGPALDQTLKSQKRFAPKVAVQIMLPLIDGLAHAHAIGVAHRDLKPSNVAFSQNASGQWAPMLLDFGLSKPTQGSAKEFRLTTEGQTVGTPAYMAPEMLRSDEGGNATSDVWSLGVMLFELITGALPYRAESIWHMLMAILTTDAPTMTSKGVEVDPTLEFIVGQCMKREPNERFADASALRNALSSWLKGAG